MLLNNFYLIRFLNNTDIDHNNAKPTKNGLQKSVIDLHTGPAWTDRLVHNRFELDLNFTYITAID